MTQRQLISQYYQSDIRFSHCSLSLSLFLPRSSHIYLPWYARTKKVCCIGSAQNIATINLVALGCVIIDSRWASLEIIYKDFIMGDWVGILKYFLIELRSHRQIVTGLSKYHDVWPMYLIFRFCYNDRENGIDKLHLSSVDGILSFFYSYCLLL